MEELDHIDLIKLVLYTFLMNILISEKEEKKKKKLFIFAWTTSIVPDIDNSIYYRFSQGIKENGHKGL